MSRTAPRWQIAVNGNPVPPGYKSMISTVTVKATLDGADELTIEADAYDSHAGAWRIVSDNLLSPGNSAVVSMGYESGLEALQRFEIVRSKTIYPEGGIPRVQITGYSAEHRLAAYTRPRQWEGPISDSEIAEDIARQHGLTVDAASVEASPRGVQGRAKKAGVSDLDFLQGLARVHAFDPPWVRFDEARGVDVFYFRRPGLNLQETVYQFDYRISLTGKGGGWLRSFRPEISIADVPTQVEVVGWDPVEQEAVKVVVQLGEDGGQTQVYSGAAVEEIDAPPASGSELRVVLLRNTRDPQQQARDRLHVHRIQTTEDARAWARRWLATRNVGFQNARADLWGLETLWPSQIHRVGGVAPVHAGAWQFVAVTHVMGPDGYGCKADLVRVLEDAEAGQEVAG